MLMSLLRHADRVKVGCLAQLVNALAPIMTEPNGAAWKQTTYYPYLHVCQYGHGTALQTVVSSPTYATENYGDVPLLDTAATLDEANNTLTIFAVNRDQQDGLQLSADLRAFGGNLRVLEHLVLEHADRKAENTLAQPDTVLPSATGDARAEAGTVTAHLPRLSWNVIRLGF